MFDSLWNSLDHVSRALNWTQIILIIFSMGAASFGVAQFSLNQRKDTLSGNTQKQKELLLNQKIAQASEDANNSILQLETTKASLAGTQIQLSSVARDATAATQQLLAAQSKLEISQRQLAQATADANAHLQDYLASKEKVNSLERRAQKVVTLQLRVEMVASLPTGQIGTLNTNIGMNILTFLTKPSSSDGRFLFRSGEVREIPVGANLIRYTCTLDPESPLAISGIDVSALDGNTAIVTNFIQFLSGQLKSKGIKAESMQWTLIINGATFPLNRNVLASQSDYKEQVMTIPIPQEYRLVSVAYNSLIH